MAYGTRRFSYLQAWLRNAHRPSFYRQMLHGALQADFDQRCRHLTRISVNALAGQAGALQLQLEQPHWGESDFLDLAALCLLVRIQRPKRIFEFGTYTGNATLNMAFNAPEDCKVFTLDLAPEQRKHVTGLNWEKDVNDSLVGSRFSSHPLRHRITQLFGDSRTFDVEPYRNQCDFIWIDACHEYEFVVNDSEKAFALAAPGATIAWHDLSTNCPGVGRHLRELATRHSILRVGNSRLAFCRV